MNAKTRVRLQRLEAVLSDLDWQEQLAVDKLRRAGWGFTSIPAARRYLTQLRTAAQQRRAADERMNELLEGSNA